MSQHRRASRTRVGVLAGAVALAAALPLAIAMAGTSEHRTASPVPRTGVDDVRAADDLFDDFGGTVGGLGDSAGGVPQLDTSGGEDTSGAADGGADDAAEGAAQGGTEGGADLPAAGGPQRPGGTGLSGSGAHIRARGPAATCGPEVTAPGAVTAQTCVLTEEGQTWGRTYHRVLGGEALRAVLTLMRPDGRTVQVHCALSGQGRPGLCETPRQRTVHPVDDEPPYRAVAEFAPPGEDRLLLRAGSNSPGALAD
ncbi:hypothetical protein QNO07_16355 [Streptomyces sp. 549]|uniref:hypothetical protein n=1 Tax=Streptomyces sp. 549 TaxID=3049076 RepID=UPI0024C2C499|nr:hypothetical protein [Streptomyces sp. 549]MDK1474969.1 hypothetical protein [Streptomyces sp. 549]